MYEGICVLLKAAPIQSARGNMYRVYSLGVGKNSSGLHGAPNYEMSYSLNSLKGGYIGII